MSEFYKMARLDWQNWNNFTHITFWDIISNYFDIESLVWKFEKNELEMVHFMGKGESVHGNVDVCFSFVFANDTPMIVFNQIKNNEEILLSNEINEIAEEYDVDYGLAMALCDVVSGALFLPSFYRF